MIDTLEARVKELDCFLDAIPRNSEDKSKLIECGYNSSLWEEVSYLYLTSAIMDYYVQE